MENLGQFWWVAVIVALIALLTVVVIIRQRVVEKRRAEQSRTDWLVLQGFKDVVESHQRAEYVALPNSICRLEWLARNYPEFAAVAERQFPQSGLETAAFYHFDLDLIRGAAYYCNPETAFRRFRNTAIAMSLTEYQGVLDAYNDEQAQSVKKRRAEKQARLEREASELAIRTEEAKTHWDSLTDEQKSAFKKAPGKSARKAILTATSTNGSIEALYPLIMAMEFGKVKANDNHSIDYSNSSSHHSGFSSHSSHSSDGSHSSHHGSSFSSHHGGHDGVSSGGHH